MLQLSKNPIDSQTKGAESSFANFLEIAVISVISSGDTTACFVKTMKLPNIF